MATARAVDRPFDNVGQSYNAIRIGWLWNLAVPDALTHSTGVFLANTKVVRVTPSFGLHIGLTIIRTSGNQGPIVIGNGVFQDIHTEVGDAMSLVGLAGFTANTWVSILELN